MNDENNQGLVKAVDRLTQQIKKSTQIIMALVFLFTGLYFLKITPPYDTSGFVESIIFAFGGLIMLIMSIYL